MGWKRQSILQNENGARGGVDAVASSTTNKFGFCDCRSIVLDMTVDSRSCYHFLTDYFGRL